jgi:hypothetical protein
LRKTTLVFLLLFAISSVSAAIAKPKRIIPPYGGENSFGMCGSLWADEVLPRGDVFAIEGAVMYAKTFKGHLWALNLEEQDVNNEFQVIQLRDDCHMGEFVEIPKRCIASEKRWSWSEVTGFLKSNVTKKRYAEFMQNLPPFLRSRGVIVP